jgi:8-oxo-dGTP diphosphatase
MNEDVFHLGVKALIRNEEGKFLLLKENTVGWKKAVEPYWDIPGGRIHRDEDLEVALRREVFEETGIHDFAVVDQLHITFSKYRIPAGDSGLDTDVGVILSAYICEVAGDVTIALSGESLEWGWFTAIEASELLGVRYPKSFTEQVGIL